MRSTVVLALAGVLTLSAGLEAQEQDQQVREELRALVTEADHAEADRAVVSDFLQREDVQQVAEERGLDIERAESGLQSLSSGEVSSIAQRVLDTEGQLAGGDTIVITSTTIIIILLILILLSV